MLLRVSIFPEEFILIFGGMVQVEELGDAVPQAPLGFIAFMLLQQKVGPGDHPGSPGLSAVCSLQTALGLRPRRALSSAEAKELRLLVQIGSGPFPVSVSFRVYRAGNGKREFELVASGIANDFAGSG